MEGQFDKPSTPAGPEPAPATAPARTDRLGNAQMLMIGVALIGGGALMISVLSARGSAVAEPAATPRPVAPSTPAPALDLAAVEAGGGWIENTEQWTPKTRRRVAFELAAVKDTQVWMKTVRPLLVVRCVQGEMEAFVFTDSAATMEAQDEDHAVRLWFDEGNQQTERWPDSSAHDALFAPDGARFAAQVMQARTVRFGYHPHNAAPVVAQFNVAGLRQKIDASPACRAKR